MPAPDRETQPGPSGPSDPSGAPLPSMRALLDSCAAASAVSTPPPAPESAEAEADADAEPGESASGVTFPRPATGSPTVPGGRREAA